MLRAVAGVQTIIAAMKAWLVSCALMVVGTACFAAVPAYRDFPTRPVRLVVPYPAGGGGDAGARIIAAALQERFGQPVVVDNRGGANTIVGSEYVANASADGYTLLFCVSALASNASLYKTRYDPVRSFTPISLVLRSTMVLVVHPAFPAREVKAAATVSASDFRGLRKLQAAAGKRFCSGVVLYDGETSAGFGNGMYAVPVRALWELT